MFLRLVKTVLNQNKKIETLRETLFSHKHFNVREAFHMLDSDNKGVLDAQKIHDGFAKFNIELNLDDLERLVVDIVDDDDDLTVDLREFTEAITPSASDFTHAGHGAMHHLSVEQRKVFQQAHMESLAELLNEIVAAHVELDGKREQLQINTEAVFDQVDTYRMGYISAGSLANWIHDNCGFKIAPYELASL
jgi:Ca2+-binding EF-hand superfamily protein